MYLEIWISFPYSLFMSQSRRPFIFRNKMHIAHTGTHISVFHLNTTTVYHVAILRKQVPSNGVLEPATLTVVPIKYNAIQLSVAPPEICSINSHKLMRYATQLNLKCKLPKLNGLRNLFMFVHSFVRSLSLFSPDVCVCEFFLLSFHFSKLNKI